MNKQTQHQWLCDCGWILTMTSKRPKLKKIKSEWQLHKKTTCDIPNSKLRDITTDQITITEAEI